LLNPAFLIRVASKLELAKGLKYTAEKSERLIEINLSFPEKPEGFEEWHKKLLAELYEAYQKFGN